MLQSLALGLIVLSGNFGVGTIFALAAVQGVVTAFDNPTRRSFVVEMVPTANVANAVSLNSTLMTSARMVGPAIAGILIALVGYAWCFLIDGVSYLVVLGALALMRTAELHSEPPASRRPGQVREGLRYIASNQEQLVPLVMMALIGTFAFNFSVTSPLLVTGPLGGTEQTYTLLVSTISFGSVVGAIATARRRTIPFRHLIWASAGFGLAMVFLALSPNLGFAFPAGFLVGLGSISFMTTATAMMQLQADPQFRGRVLALQAMVFLGTTPIGSPIVGWIADNYGPRLAMLLGAAACLGAAAYGARHDRNRQPVIATAPPILID